MPDAEAVKVAKEVYNVLNGAKLSQEFNLERGYAAWDLKLDGDHDQPLRIDVAIVTTRQEPELANRGGDINYTVPIDVCIRKKFGPEDQDDDTGRIANEKIDPLMYFVQEVHKLFVMRRLANDLNIAWKENPTLTVAPQIKLLREHRQFTALIRLVFVATP